MAKIRKETTFLKRTVRARVRTRTRTRTRTKMKGLRYVIWTNSLRAVSQAVKAVRRSARRERQKEFKKMWVEWKKRSNLKEGKKRETHHLTLLPGWRLEMTQAARIVGTYK